MFDLFESVANKQINLKGVPRTARSLIARTVAVLGSGWQATLFLSHVILYRERREYRHGEPILPAD